MLQKADPDQVTEKTRTALQKIVTSCNLCKLYASFPRRFKYTLSAEVQLNSTVYVCIFRIEKKKVLQVIDEASRYQAERWVSLEGAERIWEALSLC